MDQCKGEWYEGMDDAIFSVVGREHTREKYGVACQVSITSILKPQAILMQP
jgi:hypothetical protein